MQITYEGPGDNMLSMLSSSFMSHERNARLALAVNAVCALWKRYLMGVLEAWLSEGDFHPSSTTPIHSKQPALSAQR